MSILSRFREEANKLLHQAGIDGEVVTAKEEFGDFTYPCFTLAKNLGKNPVEVAEDIVKRLPVSPYFSEIKNVGPYINFTISPHYLAEQFLKYVIDGEIFKFKRRERIVLEHTSANPTGPLHVGRARNPIIGDAMARILRRYGHDVVVHYFVNDAGMQVATLLWGLKNLNLKDIEAEKCDHKLVKYYQESSKLAEKEKSVEEEIREILKKYEQGEGGLRKFARDKVGCVLNGINQTLERMGVKIDKFVWESDLIPFAREIAKELEEDLEEEDGAFYIDMKKLGIKGKERIYLYRRDGTTLYFLRDIAYHIKKSEEGVYLIDVLGEDHKLHFTALKAVLKRMGIDVKLRPLFYSFVRLPEGKMSTRRGTVVYLDDLLEEGIKKATGIVRERGYEENMVQKIGESVAISAIRFSILNVQEDKPIVFRWDRALNFEGESGPFIMYSYARASSILKKATWNKVYYPEEVNHPQEIKLLKLMARYEDVIEESVQKLSPYVVARYTYNLANQFNQFYRDCPVIHSIGKKRETRLAMVYAFKEIMGDLMHLLGLKILEKM